MDSTLCSQCRRLDCHCSRSNHRVTSTDLVRVSRPSLTPEGESHTDKARHHEAQVTVHCNQGIFGPKPKKLLHFRSMPIPTDHWVRFVDLKEFLLRRLVGYTKKDGLLLEQCSVSFAFLGSCLEEAQPCILVTCQRPALKIILSFCSQKAVKEQLQPPLSHDFPSFKLYALATPSEPPGISMDSSQYNEHAVGSNGLHTHKMFAQKAGAWVKSTIRGIVCALQHPLLENQRETSLRSLLAKSSVVFGPLILSRLRPGPITLPYLVAQRYSVSSTRSVSAKLQYDHLHYNESEGNTQATNITEYNDGLETKAQIPAVPHNKDESKPTYQVPFIAYGTNDSQASNRDLSGGGGYGSGGCSGYGSSYPYYTKSHWFHGHDRSEVEDRVGCWSPDSLSSHKDRVDIWSDHPKKSKLPHDSTSMMQLRPHTRPTSVNFSL